MHIQFEVAQVPAQFRWNNIQARAELRLGEAVTVLQQPADPTCYASPDPVRAWHHEQDGHRIEIVKQRMPADSRRRSTFTIRVDGQVVAEEAGT